MATSTYSPTPRRMRRSFVSFSVLATLSATLISSGGCSSEDPLPQPLGATTAGTTGTSATTGTTGTTGTTESTGTTGTTGTTESTGTTGTTSDPMGSGGNSSTTGGSSGGGPATGGTTGSGGSGTGGSKPCVDIDPPYDPNWPEADGCTSWVLEAEPNPCGEDWFSGYCDASCGRCEGESSLPMAPDCSGENLPNVSGNEGHATRYWDCCQTHCAQNAGAQKCSKDGVSNTGDSNSACQGGGSYACYNEAPREVSKCLSYGHIAKANADCGGCYRIQFTGQGEHNANDIGSKLIQGKQMIVKVSNTGSDVGNNQFDLMVPGGGVGMFDACTNNQWNTSDLGARSGGFLSSCSGTHAEKKECVRKGCMNIPAGDARDGCLWFVDWFEIADNPKFTSEKTNCPF